MAGIVEQYIAAIRLVSQAERLDNKLRIAWLDALAAESQQAERLECIRRKSLQRIERRRNAYHALVYGEVQS